MPEKGNYPGGVTFEPVVNPVFRDALIKRLAEVHSQATEEKLFFRAPEQKIFWIAYQEIGDALLDGHRVNLWEKSRELTERFGGKIDREAYDAACTDLQDLCMTGGQNLKPLPPIQ